MATPARAADGDAALVIVGREAKALSCGAGEVASASGALTAARLACGVGLVVARGWVTLAATPGFRAAGCARPAGGSCGVLGLAAAEPAT